MTRIHNSAGGGAQTNANGLSYERKHHLRKAIIESNKYTVDSQEFVINTSTNQKVGLLAPKYDFYKYLKKQGVLWKKIVSKKYLSYEAFFNSHNKVLYIVEKKYQNVPGSVDEKLQTFPFKKERYENLVNHINYRVEFYFLGNSYFDKNMFTNIWNYFARNSIKKFIAMNIPLEAFGLLP